MGVRDAEDVVHDVFVRLINSASQFNPGKGTLRVWLFRIARNRCVDLGRRSRIVRWTGSEPASVSEESSGRVLDSVADPCADAETGLMAASVAEAVRGCLDEIRSPEARQALTLYYLAGKVLREVGEILGKSTSSARNYVDAARQQVKGCLERKGITGVA